MEDIVKKWLQRAKYDLNTAEAMFISKRYLYVAFMCQQALEKIFKAIIIDGGGEIARTHNLVRLMELAKIRVDENTLNHFADLTPFAIESRYGDYRKTLSEIINKKRSGVYLKRTIEIFRWLRKKLK